MLTEFLSRLSAGLLSPSDVRPGLSLLLALTIELVSAFGPTVLSNYAEATERSEGKARDNPADRIADHLAERLEPAANTDRLSESALYADYAAWCRAFGLAAVSAAEFVTGFDQLRVENGLNIRKRKGGYGGVKLASFAVKRARRAHVAVSRLVVLCRGLSPPVATCRDLSGRESLSASRTACAGRTRCTPLR